MNNTIYMPDDQRERHPAVGQAFDALGSLLSRESAREQDSRVYAQIVKRLLAVVSAPTVVVSDDARYGGKNYAVTHPDSRVVEAFRYMDGRQLRELGLLPDPAPTVPT